MTTTPELLEALTNHFVKPDETWPGAVCLTEVTAPGGNRRADLVHIGLWSSRGAGSIDVCELKTSRADFRREIEQPAKAEAWWPYSSRFWIVSPGVEITPPDELPPGWGLLVPSRTRRFKTVIKPEEREPRITTQLLVTLLTCTETTRNKALDYQRRTLRDDHHRELSEVRRQSVNRSDPGVKRRLDLLDRLESALGTPLSEYEWDDGILPEIAAGALRILAAEQTAQSSARERAQRAAQDIDRLAADLARTATQLRSALPASASDSVSGSGAYRR